MLHPTPRHKRVFWTVSAILSTLFTIGLLALFALSCTPKKTKTGGKTIIVCDTTRVRLQHQADMAVDSVIILKEHHKPDKTAYENAVIQYDSARIHLPF